MQSNTSLKKVLRPVHLWALAVGLVISGEYFGWNLGWKDAGTIGFLILTLIITLLYVTFIFSFTELSAAIPDAGGPFAYSRHALGPIGGFIAGYATIVEFLFAPPAIAVALGGYMHFLNPSFNPTYVAYICYFIFTLINLSGIKESAIFNLVVTILAITELTIFMGITAPHFKWSNFVQNPMPGGWQGLLPALPFAIWFYLGIEGVAMVAEEVKNPQRDFKKGYIYGIATLALLALGVMLCTGGITDWRQLSTTDDPLPDAMRVVLGGQNKFTNLFAGIGLFGLIASFHSLIISCSRQMFALSRSGYLPSFLSSVNRRFKTPHWALITGAVIGIIAIATGTTGTIIILSVIGALVMYIISMVSLLVLRKKQPLLQRPFKVPLYPVFPLTTLVLSAASLLAIAWYDMQLTVWFFAGMAVLLAILMLSGKHRQKSQDIILTSATEASPAENAL
ncbi:MAG TPA: ethanolamine permease [Chitinophagaceae bacterium]|nr:ethanolamine permease [Chitinophagaceae bacterium]